MTAELITLIKIQGWVINVIKQESTPSSCKDNSQIILNHYKGWRNLFSSQYYSNCKRYFCFSFRALIRTFNLGGKKNYVCNTETKMTYIFNDSPEFSNLFCSPFVWCVCGGLKVSALVPGASGPGSSTGRGHCVVFLGKTLNSHSASLHPGV